MSTQAVEAAMSEKEAPRTGPTAAVGPTIEFQVHFRHGNRGRRRLRAGSRHVPPVVAPGRVPRVSRLLALAIRFDGLIRQGAVKDHAELARLGGVSRTRISQIMDLLNLAPDIQEEILFLARVEGRDPVTERGLRRVVEEEDWAAQYCIWVGMLGRSPGPSMGGPGVEAPVRRLRRGRGSHCQVASCVAGGLGKNLA